MTEHGAKQRAWNVEKLEHIMESYEVAIKMFYLDGKYFVTDGTTMGEGCEILNNAITSFIDKRGL